MSIQKILDIIASRAYEYDGKKKEELFNALISLSPSEVEEFKRIVHDKNYDNFDNGTLRWCICGM